MARLACPASCCTSRKEPPASGDLAGGAGDEGAPSGMGGTPGKAQRRIEPVEPELHRVGREAPAALGEDDRVPRLHILRAPDAAP